MLLLNASAAAAAATAVKSAKLFWDNRHNAHPHKKTTVSKRKTDDDLEQ